MSEFPENLYLSPPQKKKKNIVFYSISVASWPPTSQEVDLQSYPPLLSLAKNKTF
jgi:hypothetical protein